MPIRVTTRHSEDFDILTPVTDPAKSPYAQSRPQYAQRVLALYTELGIRSALWTTPGDEPPQYVESIKPIEYLLEIEENRILAYVDEMSWSLYLHGEMASFRYSRIPMRYEMTSILIGTPVLPGEVKEYRRYRQLNGPSKFELVERRPWDKKGMRNG